MEDACRAHFGGWIGSEDVPLSSELCTEHAQHLSEVEHPGGKTRWSDAESGER